MAGNAFLHERVNLAGIVNPATMNSTPVLTGAIDMSKWSEVMAVLCLGDMAAETIDFKAQDCATSGGSYADITGKAMTQLAASATNNDNKQAIITVKSEELNAGAQFVKFRGVTGGATGGPAAIVVLGVPKYQPASDDKLTSVVQTVA
jgi:hypothetical protein